MENFGIYRKTVALSTKGKAKTILGISFACFVLLQSVALRYRVSHASGGNDVLVFQEASVLEKLWEQTDVNHLVTVETFANPTELEQARKRLELAHTGIRASEKRVQGAKGKRKEFFHRAHAYYYHSISALINITDFLLAKRAEYHVNDSGIDFDADQDAEKFRGLIAELTVLQEEKKALDAFISDYNQSVEKELSPRVGRRCTTSKYEIGRFD